MKNIGIVCDDYKLPHFEKELTKRGFDNHTVHVGPTTDLRTIQVHVEDEHFKRDSESVRRLCKKLEYSRPWKN